MLLMATPCADITHAYNVVMTSGSANDCSTPDQPRATGCTAQWTHRRSQSRCSAGNPTEERCNETNCRQRAFDYWRIIDTDIGDRVDKGVRQ